MNTIYINVIVSGPAVQTLFEKTFDKLNKEVNLRINEGYKPIGGVNIYKFTEYDDLKYAYEHMRLIQTMTKEI